MWITKFSNDGRYLAVGGKDGTVRGESFPLVFYRVYSMLHGSIVWEVLSTPDERRAAMFPDPVDASGVPSPSGSGASDVGGKKKATRVPVAVMPVFNSTPLWTYKGHEADVLDLSWSKVSVRLFSDDWVADERSRTTSCCQVRWTRPSGSGKYLELSVSVLSRFVYPP